MNNIPHKILSSWERVNKRIDDYCNHQREEAFSILFVTDVHIGKPNNFHINQLTYLHDLLAMNQCDLIVNGGDIGLDVGEDDDEAKRVIELTKEETLFDTPYFYIRGNHDYHPAVTNNHELNLILNQNFIKNTDNKKECIVLDEINGGGYGYFIDSKTDTRAIFLNTSENIRGYDVSLKQLDFLVDQLEKAQEANILLFSHYCINKCGEWKSYPFNNCSLGIRALIDIEKCFANKEKGSFENLKWDFQNKKNQILIHLAGDSHFNNQSNSDGYLIACRQGYGGVELSELPSGASFDIFDKHELCNYDILVIKKNKQAKLFRVGAGEKIRDIVIN